MLPRALHKIFWALFTQRLRRATLSFQETVHATRTTELLLQSLYTFLDMSEILGLRVDIEGLIDRVVRAASQLMHADRASLFLTEPH